MRNILASRYFLTLLFFYSGTVDCNMYDGPIAGNKSITECINGDKKQYSDLDITTAEAIVKEGYPVENHVVLTDDGYLLTLVRIPAQPGAPAVFFQHGLGSTSFDWVILGKDKAIAYLLADKGYDIWLGNNRGSFYSRCHINYTTTDSNFWNFSFHEIGIYDLPAVITYVTKIKNDSIIYVGHSMGTTVSYVMAIERPDIASKLKAIISLAPIAFLYYLKSPIQILIPGLPALEFLSRHIWIGEFFPQGILWKAIVKYGCSMFLIEEKFCAYVIFILAGSDAPELNYSFIPLFLNNYPMGISINSVIHYGQEVISGRFRKYDYGTKKNLQMYDSAEPPDYNISKIQVPVGIFWAENDYLSSPKDVKHFYDQLPVKLFNYKVNYSKINHFDYLIANDAPELIYFKLISYIENISIMTPHPNN